VAAIRARLARRGWTPVPRSIGHVHTFAAIARVAWHDALFGDLHTLGPVTEFDYAALGYRPEQLWRLDAAANTARDRISATLLSQLRAAHQRHPVDWVFVYANGSEINASAIRVVAEELGIPTVNMCLDDKQSWTGPSSGGQRPGQIDIGPEFDISWTSARVACEWYLVEGARPLYLPEGFDAAAFRPVQVERDIPVSFVGAAYGFRPAVVRHLESAGIPVQSFGAGWPNGAVWGEAQVEVFNRSRINLGMGGIGFSEELKNVKARDFEVPGTGGGLYLTSYNADLAQHFVIGEEIACYADRHELVDLVRYYLQRPDEADRIAARGRARCLAQHRWLHRYQEILDVLGILDERSEQCD